MEIADLNYNTDINFQFKIACLAIQNLIFYLTKYPNLLDINICYWTLIYFTGQMGLFYWTQNTGHLLIIYWTKRSNLLNAKSAPIKKAKIPKKMTTDYDEHLKIHYFCWYIVLMIYYNDFRYLSTHNLWKLLLLSLGIHNRALIIQMQFFYHTILTEK